MTAPHWCKPVTGVGEGDGDGEGEGEGEACGSGGVSPVCADEISTTGNRTALSNHNEAQIAQTTFLTRFVRFVLLGSLISSSKRQVLVSVLR